MTWTWIREDVVLTLHDRQIAGHGGSPGVRDRGALLSALDRPRNLAVYEKPDVADLCAAYAFGIARNHPFIDGNKRVAWVAARLFLRLNGAPFTFQAEEAVCTMLALAAGSVAQVQLAVWFRDHIENDVSGPRLAARCAHPRRARPPTE